MRLLKNNEKFRQEISLANGMCEHKNEISRRHRQEGCQLDEVALEKIYNEMENTKQKVA